MTDIRVRFCPSPTGNPHVGLIRTCLFNWAYARHVLGRPPDHDGQLRLVVDALRTRRQPDRVAGADHRGRGLEEDQRQLGDLAAHLLGVVGVVLADRHDLAGQDRRQQPHIGQRPPITGEGDLAERVPVDGSDRQRVHPGSRRSLHRPPRDTGWDVGRTLMDESRYAHESQGYRRAGIGHPAYSST